MNRLPDKKKPGDPVLAADWNALLDAIAARTPRPGTGLELVASSGGFAYSSPGGAFIPRQSLPPFAVIGIEKEEGSYKVLVKEGWVIERKPKTGDTPSVKFHMPKVGEEGTLDAVPRPGITMAIGDTLWCKFETDAQGAIIGDPEMVVAGEDEDGTHYLPDDPEGSGTDGEYFVKVFKLEDDGGTPRVKVYQQSDIEHWAQLWTGENLGSGSRVYKEHVEDENAFKYRSVKGTYAISDMEGDTIEFRFEGATLGQGQPVYLPEEHADKTDEEKAEFRSIDQGDSGRDEIEVYRKDAGTIGIRGNNINGTISLSEGGSSTTLIQSQDGLVKAITSTTIYVREYDVCEDGYPVTKRFLTLD